MTARNAKVCEWTILVGIVLFGLLLVVSFRAVVPLAAVMTAVLLAFGPRRSVLREVAVSAPVRALAVFWLIGALTALWTVGPEFTLPKVAQLGAIFGLGAILIASCGQCAPFVDPDRLRRAVFLSALLCS
ncbi:MAG: hypothetical protein AAF684_07625, partial [Pseudomonadota bacterium]